MGLLSLLSAAVNVGQRISQAISRSIMSNYQQQTIKNIKKNNGYGSSSGSGSGSGSSSGSSGSGSGSGGSGGSGDSGDGSSTDSSNDSTTENVIVNDPEKNKLLSEVRMSEELRDTLNITVYLPVILKGLHTNQWFFMDVSDGFYEDNYPEVMKVVADKKYGRYAGFKKGRFFVEKIVEKGGVDGVSMELTLNPLASNYGQYTKMQLEAEKALVEALNDNGSYSNNSGTGVGGSVNSSDIIGIGNELASKYTFCSGAAQSYAQMKKDGCGSCFAWSGALYTELKAKGYTVRVIQYSTKQYAGGAGNHRSVQINNNGVWEDYPYRSTNIPKLARSTTNKPGMFVALNENGEGATSIL